MANENRGVLPHKYGFIKRYSDDTIEITNVHSEFWHYCSVGYEQAKYMYKNNLCLEEHIEIKKNLIA